MIDADEPTVVVCFRVADEPRPAIDGATRDVCRDCKAEVWISPATRKIKEEKDGSCLCFQCAAPAIENAKDPRIEIKPSQIEEAADQLRRDLGKN